MSDPTTRPIALDIDGYFRQSVDASNAYNSDLKENPDRIGRFNARLREDPSLRDLFELYYLVIRAACVPFDVDDGDEEHLRQTHHALQLWRKSALGSAMGLAYTHVTRGEPPVPDWVEVARRTIANTLSSKFSTIGDIQVVTKMAPRFSARARRNGVIEVSGLTRTLLRHYNLTVSSAADRAASDEGCLQHEPNTNGVLRFTLPYFIYGHDIVRTASLPYCSAASQDTLASAITLTQIQVTFILAHEYAHLLLDHVSVPTASKADRQEMERAADDFALETCLAIAEKLDDAGSSAVWTAVRWLFQYQLVDHLVGALIRRRNFDEEPEFERRRTRLEAAMLARYPKEMITHFEIGGTYTLFALKQALQELGASFLEFVYDALREATPDKIVPWWERANSVSKPEVWVRRIGQGG